MSRAKTQPTANAKISWRHEYHRILTDGPNHFSEGDPITPEVQSDLDLMAELIDGGYADGNYSKDQSGNIDSVMWRGPTVSGRLFADELADWISRRTWKHRIKLALIAFFGWVVGHIQEIIRFFTGP